MTVKEMNAHLQGVVVSVHEDAPGSPPVEARMGEAQRYAKDEEPAEANAVCVFVLRIWW